MILQRRAILLEEAPPPHGKSALGSFSKVLVSLLIAALVLGCFVGAVSAADVYKWGYQDTGGANLILLIEYGSNQLKITDAYVSNITGSDYLYLSESRIASFENVSEQNVLIGYHYLDTDSWCNSQERSANRFFDYDGQMTGDVIGEYINSIEQQGWNYSAQSDLTLYANFYPNNTYINLSANGGSFPKPDDSEEEWDDGLLTGGSISTGESEITWESGYVDPVRDGYKFIGWALNYDGTKLVAGAGLNGKEYGHILPLMYSGASNEYFKINSVADGEHTWIALKNEVGVTLYAKWEKIEESSGSSSAIILIGSKSSGGNGPHIEHKYVTFDANGGNGEMAKQQFTGGQTKALSLNQFTREGFNFAGWALEPTGMVTFTDGEEIMVDEDITIYAVWVEPVPDTPDVPADDGETGIPIWAAVLGGVVILAVTIGLIVYFFVIRRGGA